MFKQNKWKLVVSSLAILLPILAGVCFWNKLPDQVPMHWNAQGEVDGYGSRAMLVFGMPAVMLAVHWVAVFITALDPKNRDQSQKVMGLTLWIVPIVSLFLSAIMYPMAMGHALPITKLTMSWIGLLFVVLGNYMPKCKQNSTIGIRVPWTLDNEENWNATHRFAGRMWVGGGLLILACMLLPSSVFMGAVIALSLVLTVSTIVYSYVYYCRHK